jgi:hypothetical protein
VVYCHSDELPSVCYLRISRASGGTCASARACSRLHGPGVWVYIHSHVNNGLQSDFNHIRHTFVYEYLEVLEHRWA